ncbi:SDR family NAD(P)-dependent oxidoreductase [Rhodococcus sp. NPDC127530]|uniref:SDR family NAD(P)-dependent oxidoreductase n=1 Tax=unclassified Rhodococcus (in: high G+C Gram-positive bacteria) TaxID=192944 RepID=UPI00362B2F11
MTERREPGLDLPVYVGDDLQGRTAIVTGAGAQASGIGNGRAAAVLLARAGARVVLVDAVADRLDETIDLVAQVGGESLPVVADVTDETACRNIVEATLERFGGVDVLVNNVGVGGPPDDVVDLDIEAWRRLVDLNLTSMILMSKFTIPHMRAAGRGSIVHLSSLGGTISHPRPAYAATKGAVLSLTRSMAVTHGPEGIRVNAVAPGIVYTPMVAAEGLSDEARRQRAAMVPLRTEGTGWDVGEAVLYLAGERARWVTGTTLTVDGGFTADLRMSVSTTMHNPSR